MPESVTSSFCSPSGDSWRRWLHRVIARTWFQRITVRGSFPASGPLLIVATHRNGALDGILLHTLYPRLEFMIAARLMRHRWQRIFFGGIPVERAKDTDRRDNSGSVTASEDHILAGGALCIFPEGTSTLGPRHLPYHSGAARIAMSCRERSARLPVIVPVGLHYEDPGHFRSNVEVIIGEPLSIDMESPRPLIAVRRAIESGLEGVSVNFSCEEDQRFAQLAANRSKGFARLKSMESLRDTIASHHWQLLDQSTQALALSEPTSQNAWLGLLMAPLALPGLLLNLPILLAAEIANRKLADGPNVIALWKILAGTSMAIVWLPILFGALAFTFGWIGPAIGAAATFLTLMTWKPIRDGWCSLQFHLAPSSTRQSIRRLEELLNDDA